MALVCRELELDAKHHPPKAMAGPGVEPEERAGRLRDVRRPGPDRRDKALAEAYAEYQRRLVAAGAMDFDDLIMVTVNLFQAFPEVAAEYRRRFRHVLVDEYQDTNHAQYMLVRELVSAVPALRPKATVPEPAARSPAELCVVGDADQSIYAFRGATIRNIVEFEQDYPDATRDPAGAELPLHPEHPDRRQRGGLAATPAASPRTCGPRRGPAPPIVGYVADNEHDEAAFVAEEVDRLADAGLATPGDVASSTGPTRSPACSRKCSSGPGCPTGWSAASGSTSAARSATCWPTCG